LGVDAIGDADDFILQVCGQSLQRADGGLNRRNSNPNDILRF
jgi:hypothetical protein